MIRKTIGGLLVVALLLGFAGYVWPAFLNNGHSIFATADAPKVVQAPNCTGTDALTGVPYNVAPGATNPNIAVRTATYTGTLSITCDVLNGGTDSKGYPNYANVIVLPAQPAPITAPKCEGVDPIYGAHYEVNAGANDPLIPVRTTEYTGTMSVSCDVLNGGAASKAYPDYTNIVKMPAAAAPNPVVTGGSTTLGASTTALTTTGTTTMTVSVTGECLSPEEFSRLTAINGAGPAWSAIGHMLYNGGNPMTEDVCAYLFNRNDMSGKQYALFTLPISSSAQINTPDGNVTLYVGAGQVVTGSAATVRLFKNPTTGLLIYDPSSAYIDACTMAQGEVAYVRKEIAEGGFKSTVVLGNFNCPGLDLSTSVATAPFDATAAFASLIPSVADRAACTANANGGALIVSCAKNVGMTYPGAGTINMWKNFTAPAGCASDTVSGDTRTFAGCAAGAKFTADKITLWP